MDLINYKNHETIKSAALDRVCIEKIPNKIGQYTILKDCVIYKNSIDKSVVLKCVNGENQDFAIKITCESNEKIITKLKDVNCDYLMPIIEFGYIPGGMYYQIYPYYRRGSVVDCIYGMDEKELLKLTSDVNEALNYLHNNVGIIHMDVKSSNVFWDGNRYILGDYDISEICNKMVEEDCEEAVNKILENASSEKLYYIPRIDYILLGRMVKDIVSVKPQIQSYKIKNIINGLSVKPKGTLWGYDEIKDVTAGKYIENDKTAKSHSLVKSETEKKFVFGYDVKSGPLVAKSIDELGDLFKKYRSNAIERYINNKLNWKTLIDYIGFYDQEKSKQVEIVLNSKTSEIAIDEIINIISESPMEIYFRGTKVLNIKEDIINKLPTNECDNEFLQLCKSNQFKEFLNTVPREKQVFERAESVSGKNEDLFYYLVIYQFLSTQIFEKEIAMCTENDMSINMKDQIVRSLCTDKQKLSDNLYKIEAWLAVTGYHKEIKEIRKVCDRYE